MDDPYPASPADIVLLTARLQVREGPVPGAGVGGARLPGQVDHQRLGGAEQGDQQECQEGVHDWAGMFGLVSLSCVDESRLMNRQLIKTRILDKQFLQKTNRFYCTS